MKLKGILIICFVILIFSISSVNAQNLSFSNLQDFVDDSDNSLELNDDFTFSDDFDYGVIIDKDFKINGNNHTIDGKGASDLFTINNCNVYLENINFINGFSSNDYAPFCILNSNVTLKNCNFINNTGNLGGALYIQDNSGGLIDGCQFINNSAKQGSAIDFRICRDNTLTISNSFFNDNSPEYSLEIDNQGNAYINASGNLLNNQIYFHPHTIEKYNLVIINTSDIAYLNVRPKDLCSKLSNQTILFELFDNDKLIINTTNNGEITNYPNLGNYTLKASWNDLSATKEILVRKDFNMSMSVSDILVGEDLIVNVDLPDYLTNGAVIEIWYKDYYFRELPDPEYNSFFIEPYMSHTFPPSQKSITFPYVAEGNHLMFLKYPGDDVYREKVINQTFNVYPLDVNSTGRKTILKSDGVLKFVSHKDNFIVNLTDEKLNPLSNKEISIKVNDVSYKRITDSQGRAYLSINLNPGGYDVFVSFGGDDLYAPSGLVSFAIVESTLNISDSGLYSKSSNPFKARCRDIGGNILNEGEVEFNINGVFYHSKIQNDTYAYLDCDLESGSYIVTAKNVLTGEMQSATIDIESKFIKNNDLVKYYRNESQFHVQIDTPIQGQKIIFTINGVSYARLTDENGIAKLNINLNPGEYVITSSYDGCKVSNKITVLPVMKAENLVMTYRDGSTFNVTLVDGQGNPLKGSSVTFNINGVFYNRTTGVNGVARLNINLMAGEYIITSSYNGCNIANKITIV